MDSSGGPHGSEVDAPATHRRQWCCVGSDWRSLHTDVYRREGEKVLTHAESSARVTHVSMSLDTVCPFCARSGLIRREHVIQGLRERIELYCGWCNKTWWVNDGKPTSGLHSVQEFTRKERAES